MRYEIAERWTLGCTVMKPEWKSSTLLQKLDDELDNFSGVRGTILTRLPFLKFGCFIATRNRVFGQFLIGGRNEQSSIIAWNRPGDGIRRVAVGKSFRPDSGRKSLDRSAR